MSHREDLLQKDALLASWKILFDCLSSHPKPIEARGERDKGVKGLSRVEFASAVAEFEDERPRDVREAIAQILGTFEP